MGPEVSPTVSLRVSPKTGVPEGASDRDAPAEVSRRGHWKRGVCMKLSEIDFQMHDKFAATNLRQFCAPFM